MKEAKQPGAARLPGHELFSVFLIDRIEGLSHFITEAGRAGQGQEGGLAPAAL